MPDWKAIVRARLAGSTLSPTAEIDVTEELAQHLEDRYSQLRAAGMTDEEAATTSQREIDGQTWLTDLSDALKEG